MGFSSERQVPRHATFRRGWVALCVAAVATLATVGSVPVAQGVCCVCSCDCTPCGSCSSAGCCGSGSINSEQECATVCQTTCSGTIVRFSTDADCSAGVADSCSAGWNLCIERTNTGFCNSEPTFTGTVTATATETATATPTGTTTSTPTPTATVTATATPTLTRIPNGGACSDMSMCLSGNCVDDTCCAAPSCPAGQSCNSPGHPGECSQPTAPAPALSGPGVLAAIVLLLALGLATIRRRHA